MYSSHPKNGENKQREAAFEKKWPKDVVLRGFVPVPKCLITCMGELGLKPQDAAVLFNIIEKCWFAGDKSWQKVDTIAYSIGRKNSATRDITKSLAKKGFITKEQRYNTSNLYGLEPTAAKLAEHMKHCKHFAVKSEVHSRKSIGQDSRNPSDYIEPILPRTTNIKPNNSSHNSTIREVADPTQYGYCMGNPDGDRHGWGEYTTQRYDKKGESITRYYFACFYCGMQFHKDGERPWPSEYPLYDT